MYVQLSIDSVIGTGAFAGTVMGPARYDAFREMARELVEEFASANGWVDTTVEQHEVHDYWSGGTSTKIAAYATDDSADGGDFNLEERVATLAWQFSQESIHVVAQRYGYGVASAVLVYAKDAPEAKRRETYVEKQGGFNPWSHDAEVYDEIATLVDGDDEITSSEDLSSAVTRLRETLEKVVEEFAALEEQREYEESLETPAWRLEEERENEKYLASFDDELGDDWWEVDEAEPAPFEIKVGSDDVAKAREIVRRVLSHPDADEMTVDIFGKVLSLPAELSDGFTIVRSTTD